jgi:ribosomal protein L16 Arg81 hydroxylase
MKTIFYPKYFKDFSIFPTWEDIILDLDKNVQNKNFIKETGKLGFVTHHGENIASVNKIKKEIHQKFKPECLYSDVHIYFSMLSSSGTLGNHKDSEDVFFVLAKGFMKWVIENEEFVMNPGDMIYIPKGIFHNPIPLSPRIGISIGFPNVS